MGRAPASDKRRSNFNDINSNSGEVINMVFIPGISCVKRFADINDAVIVDLYYADLPTTYAM